MNQLQRLMKLTNAGSLACAEAIQSTNSFEEAVEYLRPVSKKSLRRGMIVTISNDCFLPTRLVGTTTKVLRKVTSENDLPTWEDNLGNNHKLTVVDVVLLEDMHKLRLGMFYLNKPFCIESPLCIRPATEKEKEQYHKLKKSKDEQ